MDMKNYEEENKGGEKRKKTQRINMVWRWRPKLTAQSP